MRLLLLLLPFGLFADEHVDILEGWELFAPESFYLTCNKGRFFDKNEVIVRYEQFSGIFDNQKSVLRYRGILDGDFISSGSIFDESTHWVDEDNNYHYFGEKIGSDYHVKINRESLAITIKQPPKLGKLRATLSCKFIDDDKAVKRQQKLWKEWEKKQKLEKEGLKKKNKI